MKLNHRLKRSAALLFTIFLIFSGKPFTAAGSTERPVGPGIPAAWWQPTDDGSWRYYTSEDSYLTDTWMQLTWQEHTDWYHFGSDGIMTIDWFQDTDGCWYYLNPMGSELPGAMKTGWLTDSPDKNWYYLEPDTGRMVLGRIVIDGNEYYFNSEGSEQSGWRWDDSLNLWIYNDKGQIPLSPPHPPLPADG